MTIDNVCCILCTLAPFLELFMVIFIIIIIILYAVSGKKSVTSFLGTIHQNK